MAGVVEFSSNSVWLLVESWLSEYNASLEVVVWRFERESFYINSLRIKLILS
jgi:hypothetical protein